MSNNNSTTDWFCACLMSMGTGTGVSAIGLDQVEQILRIVLLIVSVISFTLASILYKKKIKNIEQTIKDELKKKCP